MTLHRLQIKGNLIILFWNASTSGNSAATRFLNVAGSASTVTGTEGVGQRSSKVNFKIWRHISGITAASTQTVTLTPQIDGSPQTSLALTIGTADGFQVVDLTTPILVKNTQLLSIKSVAAGADASVINIRSWLVGEICDSW